MKKFVTSLFVWLLVIGYWLFIYSAKVNACGASGSYGQYGQPCPSYSILIDKMVAKPGTTDYVDNLSASDPRFAPGQEVLFKVKVKNTSERDITNAVVKDTVPSYLEPVEGPGTWDSSARVITWNAGDFKIDEEKTYYIKMKVVGQDSLPADQGLFCVTNKVAVTSSGPSDDDYSQLCIEKQVLGVVKVPAAGPELGIALLAGQIVTLGAGLILKRKVA